MLDQSFEVASEKGTLKRYRAACDKFRVFTSERGCTTWEQVDRALLDAYSRDLEKKKYADCTIYLELTFLKQVIKWLVAEKKLASSCLFPYPLKKTLDTTTYCWTKQKSKPSFSHRCPASTPLASRYPDGLDDDGPSYL